MGRPNRCMQAGPVLVGLGDALGDELARDLDGLGAGVVVLDEPGLTPGLGARVALAVTCGATLGRGDEGSGWAPV